MNIILRRFGIDPDDFISIPLENYESKIFTDPNLDKKSGEKSGTVENSDEIVISQEVALPPFSPTISQNIRSLRRSTRIQSAKQVKNI